MSSELETARRTLDAAPSSASKVHALELLDEIERGRAKTAEALANLETALAKLAPSPTERRIFRVLPWVVGALALVALYTGIEAVWTAEYCSRGRSRISCTYGVKAQLEGWATVAVSLLLAAVPIPAYRAKSALVWLFSLVGAVLFLASLLVRNVS